MALPDLSLIPTDRLIAFDFEFDGNTPILLGMAWKSGDSFDGVSIELQALSPEETASVCQCIVGLKALVAHHMQVDVLMLHKIGVDVFVLEGRVHDTMAMAAVMNSAAQKGLKLLASDLGVTMQDWKDVDHSNIEEYKAYNKQDCVATLVVYDDLAPKVVEGGFLDVYRMEIQVIWCAIEMNINGILIDRDRFDSVRTSIDSQATALLKEVLALAGQPVNVNSSPQLRYLIHNVFKADVNESYLTSGGKTGKRHPGTNEAALTEIATRVNVDETLRKFILKLLQYRKFNKIRTTFTTDKFEAFIQADGRVRCTLQPLQTKTGRFSAKDPNLQQVPKRGDIGKEMRNMFVAPPGHQLIRVDMSQIEYRLLAHFSGDPGLIQAYHGGADLHQAMADLMGISRDDAKNMNFGVVYGMGVRKFAAASGVTIRKARKYLDDYFARFTGIVRFKEGAVAYARSTGSIRTMSGRVRDLRQYEVYGEGYMERRAVNTIIQGAAADLLKLSMIVSRKRLKLNSIPAKMILQVHDELLFECPDEYVDRAIEIIRDAMEHTHQFSVPILAEPKAAHSWLEAA